MKTPIIIPENHALILGYFANHEAAQAVYEQLIQRKFRRVAVIRRDESGELTVTAHQYIEQRGAAIGSGAGIALGATAVRLAWPFLPGGLPAKVLLSGAAILGSAEAGRQVGGRVQSQISQQLVECYADWVMRDESLVLVFTAEMRIAKARSVLGSDETERPTIFVRRSLLELPPLEDEEKGYSRKGHDAASREQLQEYAQHLATLHQRNRAQNTEDTYNNKSIRIPEQSLLARLIDNQQVIRKLYQRLNIAAQTEGAPSLSAEWLLDNNYIIQGQIEDVKKNLGRHFYRELPQNESGVPRIYDIATTLIQHTEGRLDHENIVAFLHDYQQVTPLTIGELWALPQMLRLAIIEHQRGLFLATGQRQQDRERADFWANRLLSAAHRDPDRLHLILGALAQEEHTTHPHFVDRLVSHLYDEDIAMQPVQTWLERKCNAPLLEISNAERARHAADQVAISNSIGSQRALGQMDWNDVFEEVSLVHQTLAEDPSGIYSQMDFDTRNSYRQEVEYLAKYSDEDEIDISRQAVRLAREMPAEDNLHLVRHVGYYLLDDGRRMLESSCSYDAPLYAQLRRIIRENALSFYLGNAALLTVAGVIKVLLGKGRGHPLLALCSVLPLSNIALELVNFAVMRLLEPARLPRLDFTEGIPAERKTLVVIPMMLSNAQDVQDAVEQLEIRYLGNTDPQLRFALLADYTDANTRQTPEDASLRDIAINGIKQLNAHYAGAPFYVFLRDRRWAQSESKWMGWERKRGKLEELNAWLLGDRKEDITKLHPVCGDITELDNIRYVLTLDADTQLPPGRAQQLIETIAHPLNEAVRGTNGLVERGYTIIQPRISVSLPSANTNNFTRLFAAGAGTDPYTHAVSDVYQDLFGESSFQGKGIYDLRMFHDILAKRFPDGTILSHDLLEGAHVRTGLASDVELYDEFPSSYSGEMRRVHRWIRGDWQIADWASPRVPDKEKRLVSNPLSLLNRWKVADNLRRSLVKPVLMSVLIGSWLDKTPAIGMMAAGCLLVPAALQIAQILLPPYDNWAQKIDDCRGALLRQLVEIALLPSDATNALNAILKVGERRIFSHHGLLEWQTSQAVAHGTKNKGKRLQRRFFVGSILSLVGTAALGVMTPWTLPWAMPFLGLWSAAPFVLKWLQRGAAAELQERLSQDDRYYLRRIARRTWRYFDDFVGPQTNWLPPDNYQETLQVEIAQRTSPTNIGLWLLSVLAARDFGYLPLDDAISRIHETLRTAGELEKYNGHLLNWYNISTQEPLFPRYVSTVDSGNLLGALTALEQGFRECQHDPILGSEALRGTLDTVHVLEETLQLPADEWGRGLADTLRHLKVLLEKDCDSCTGAQLMMHLREALPLAEEFSAIVQQRSEAVVASTKLEGNLDPRLDAAELNYWAAAIETQLQSWNHLCDRYLKWMEDLHQLPEDDLTLLGNEAVAARWELLQKIPSLEALGHGDVAGVKVLLDAAKNANISTALRSWLQTFRDNFARARWLAGEMLAKNHELLDMSRKLADDMDMAFVYDPSLKLFTIGFNVDELRHDTSYYDFLSSECRIASLMAVARNEVPVEHWWALGRRFAKAYGRTVMLSWSGTMFEYLMPILLHEQRPHTLLNQVNVAAVETQMRYAKRRGIPWGISEAAFSDLDANSTYQYKAFGVPELGLQRGHENDLVVAPYASLLVLQVMPRHAIANLKTLHNLGAYGVYGFYDSLDFARQRLNDTPRTETWAEMKPFERGDRGTIVRTFMVHHQGMGLLAIANLLYSQGGEGVMQRRFHADPRIRAVTPLLHERVPSVPMLLSAQREEALPERTVSTGDLMEPSPDRFRTPDTPMPRAHLLSNGHYHVMVSNSGGGYSRWNEFDITRWRSDITTDSMGSFFYIRDMDSHALWSAAHHPVRRSARYQNVDFKAEKIEFRRRDADIETQTEVFISPEDDVEIRLLTLTNHSEVPRQIEITSYQELALAPHAADRAHPAFSKLFVQTEALSEEGNCTLLAWRRLREPSEKPIWVAHFFAPGRISHAAPATRNRCTYETSREHFLGRGGSPHRPAALQNGLTGTAGAVLDPVFSVQQQWTLAPGAHLQLAAVTVAGESREKVLLLRNKYRDFSAIERAADLAWTHSQLEMHHLRVQPEEAQLYQQLAGGMLYPHAHYRARAAQLRQNHLGQAGLWSMGVSGDLPIIVATLNHERDMATLRQVLMAHTFWSLRGLSCDLIILNRQSEGYVQSLSEQIQRLVAPHAHYTPLDKPGGIFVRNEAQIDKDHLTLLLATANIVVVSARGSLSRQLASSPTQPPLAPRLVIKNHKEDPSPPLPFMELPYFNGFGGFTGDGKEFVIYLGPDDRTPMPWINVMANPHFGQMVSETGHIYAWHGNSQNNRLTEWSNDPVMDPISDLIYIRDDQTGAFWSPTPGPIRENDAYRTRHGQGYTIWEHNSHAIVQELLSFVPLKADKSTFEENLEEISHHPEENPPLRIQRLKLKNVASHTRQLTITGYNDWVLGENPETTQLHISTQWDTRDKILLAQNSYHPEYGQMVAFSSSNPPAENFTADRTLFIGRNQSLRAPNAMRRRHLSDRCGAGLDPCAAQQFTIELEPGEEKTVYFFLGQAENVEEIRAIITYFRDPARVEEAFERTKKSWDAMLETLQVETPILSANFLLNRWLLYQNLSCRFWGRSAFYQSGGAFGFRDQLQDVMALVYMRPDLARQQLLRAAAHQFEEGDVQHWWHEPSGAGVRTRITDDLLWLPYVAMHYMEITGDAKVLLEEEYFLHAKPLEDGENEKYFAPEISEEKATLYEHCCRAIEKGCTRGPNGLPLIGTGDWNDGLNAVGEGGKGESVWLGWFLVDILRRFADVCEKCGDTDLGEEYRNRATHYVKAIEENAWDGAWYRRAYYDDGTPLGAAECDEDKIDVLPQSWGVISGAANEERAEQAMESAVEHLVKRDDKMVLLFTPAFDKSEKNPGYIKGYLPGVRENGGQYTHGALWLALAYAMQGKGSAAVDLLQLLNPVEHARDEAGVNKYKVEPYVVAADVYSLKGQEGRGGWTWYTGSAGWMYRAWIEGVLGFKPRADKLYIDPSIPANWKEYTLHWRYKSTLYTVQIDNPDSKENGVQSLMLDGERLETAYVSLNDDGKTHMVKVLL